MINVNRVFVLDKNKKHLTPCRPDRARKFLRQNKATIFRRFPFTIILRYEVKNKSNVPEKHWIDAACVGKSGFNIKLNTNMIPLTIKAKLWVGRGSR